MKFACMLKKPGAFLPVAMSVAVLTTRSAALAAIFLFQVVTLGKRGLNER